MKTQEIKNLILIQSSTNRKTSHLYSDCKLIMRAPFMEECNITKTIIYQTHNYDRDHLKMVKIQYEDGYSFGKILVGFTVLGNGRYMLEHISPIKDHNWTMVLAKKEAPVMLLINERKTYGRMYTSFSNGSLKYVFKEQIYEGDSEYDLPAEYGGDYTTKCKACDTVYQTQFIKIYQCPVCGYSKNNNIKRGE